MKKQPECPKISHYFPGYNIRDAYGNRTDSGKRIVNKRIRQGAKRQLRRDLAE